SGKCVTPHPTAAEPTSTTSASAASARVKEKELRLALVCYTRLYMCHDYKAPGREHYAWETTVAEERARNVHVRDGVSESEFVSVRAARDATLPAPTLLLP